MEDFTYDDFTWNMVQPESRSLSKYIAEKIPMELTFIDGEVMIGKIKWYDEMSIGILNSLNEEIYIDKRSLKWFRPMLTS